MDAALPPPHVVDTSACTGEIHDQGAQVTRWAPKGAAPALYVSSAVRLAEGRSIRAGIPVCWPWFGAGQRPGMEPAHGFARTAPWTLVDRSEDAATGEVTFVHRLTSDAATSPHFPQPYAVELRSRFGATRRPTPGQRPSRSRKRCTPTSPSATCARSPSRAWTAPPTSTR